MIGTTLSRLFALSLLLLCLPGCEDIEGNQPGECTDGADNDSNGYFDCDDRSCFGAPDCTGEGPDDDDAADDDDTTNDDDDTSIDDDDTGDDDDLVADDDDTGGDGVTPWIESVTYVYNAAGGSFLFSIEAHDPDNNFGVPLLLWSIDAAAQPPVAVGTIPLQGDAYFDVEMQDAVASQTYQVLFAIRDADQNVSEGVSISATAQ